VGNVPCLQSSVGRRYLRYSGEGLWRLECYCRITETPFPMLPFLWDSYNSVTITSNVQITCGPQYDGALGLYLRRTRAHMALPVLYQSWPAVGNNLACVTRDMLLTCLFGRLMIDPCVAFTASHATLPRTPCCHHRAGGLPPGCHTGSRLNIPRHKTGYTGSWTSPPPQSSSPPSMADDEAYNSSGQSLEADVS
jgi:hypothetical protein